MNVQDSAEPATRPEAETASYDLAVWYEAEPISAAEALRSYLALADEALEACEPASVKAFAEQLLGCFPDVAHDALPPAPGSRNALIEAMAGECYVYEAGAYISFPPALAPDLTPLVCHLADVHGLVVYDRQRQGVFLPATLNVPHTVRVTAGDGFVVAHDPRPADIPELLDAAARSGWFRIVERGPNHYLQAAPSDRAVERGTGPRLAGGDGEWTVEHRDGDGERHHFQASGASLDQVKQAFVLFTVGGSRWKDLFDWSPLATT